MPLLYRIKRNGVMKKITYIPGSGQRELLVTILLFTIPTLLLLIVFQLVPIIKAVQYSLYSYNLISGKKVFLGLKNYVNAFKDQQFLHSLKVTVNYFLLRVPLQLIFGFLLALLLVRKHKWTDAFRTFILLPVVTSMVVITTILGLMMHPTNGLFNAMLQLVGIPHQPFLTSPGQALYSIVGITVWKNVGLTMLFFLAGMFAIPASYYEAATIDGASYLQQQIYITLPLIKRTIVFLLMTISIRAFQVFGPILLTTGGGPVDSTRVVVMHIYEYAFTFNRMGYASAMSVILALILIVVTGLQRYYTSRNRRSSI